MSSSYRFISSILIHLPGEEHLFVLQGCLAMSFIEVAVDDKSAISSVKGLHEMEIEDK